jgi:hypothetical protein
LKGLRFIAALALLACAPALATTALFADLPELAARAELVIRGKVMSSESRWTDDGRRIVTDVQVEVAEVLKGAPRARLTVRQPGGQVGTLGQRVDGVAAFTVGEEVVLFLERRPDDSFHLAGMAQGKLRVERTTDGRAAYAVPESVGEMFLLDPLTRAPRSPRTQALELEELRAVISESVKSGSPPRPSRTR